MNIFFLKLNSNNKASWLIIIANIFIVNSFLCIYGYNHGSFCWKFGFFVLLWSLFLWLIFLIVETSSLKLFFFFFILGIFFFLALQTYWWVESMQSAFLSLKSDLNNVRLQVAVLEGKRLYWESLSVLDPVWLISHSWGVFECFYPHLFSFMIVDYQVCLVTYNFLKWYFFRRYIIWWV